MTEMDQIFTGESCKPNKSILINVKIFGPYLGHVWPILVPCFDYSYHIFASLCLNWFKFWMKSHALQTNWYHVMLHYWKYFGTIFVPFWGHVLAIYTIYFLLEVWNGSNFHWESWRDSRKLHCKTPYASSEQSKNSI